MKPTIFAFLTLCSFSAIYAQDRESLCEIKRAMVIEEITSGNQTRTEAGKELLEIFSNLDQKRIADLLKNIEDTKKLQAEHYWSMDEDDSLSELNWGLTLSEDIRYHELLKKKDLSPDEKIELEKLHHKESQGAKILTRSEEEARTRLRLEHDDAQKAMKIEADAINEYNNFLRSSFSEGVTMLPNMKVVDRDYLFQMKSYNAEVSNYYLRPINEPCDYHYFSSRKSLCYFPPLYIPADLESHSVEGFYIEGALITADLEGNIRIELSSVPNKYAGDYFNGDIELVYNIGTKELSINYGLNKEALLIENVPYVSYDDYPFSSMFRKLEKYVSLETLIGLSMPADCPKGGSEIEERINNSTQSIKNIEQNDSNFSSNYKTSNQ